MTRIYVAGPMTGLPEFNYPAFRSAAASLAEAGHQVEDPSTNENPTPGDYHGWLRAGLAQLIRCDGVALLDGWEASGGARLEVNIAATLGMSVKPLAEWLWRDVAPTRAGAPDVHPFTSDPEGYCVECGEEREHPNHRRNLTVVPREETAA